MYGIPFFLLIYKNLFLERLRGERRHLHTTQERCVLLFPYYRTRLVYIRRCRTRRLFLNFQILHFSTRHADSAALSVYYVVKMLFKLNGRLHACLFRQFSDVFYIQQRACSFADSYPVFLGTAY